MKTPTASARHYVVSLQHRCAEKSSTAPSAHDVAAANLPQLLRLLRAGGNPDLTCTFCGPQGMAVASIRVVVGEADLRERLGPFAGELLATG